MLRIRTVITGVAGSPWYTNMHFGGIDQAAAQDAADAVYAFWQDWYASMRTGAVISIETFVPVINELNGENIGGHTVTGVPPINTTGNLQALPAANQGLMRLLTGEYEGGRQIQGKVFIPDLLVTAAGADGRPNSGLIGLIESSGQDLVDAGIGVYSRKNARWVPAVDAQGATKFAVLRSRRD